MAPKKTSPPSAKPTEGPRNMADGVDGVVEFKTRSGSSYRYTIVAKDDKLRIWLEDRTTKKQWQTTDLAMKDFVKADSVIPHSTFTDYVMCFVDCMESPLLSDDFSRELVPSKTDKEAWELRLTLNIRVFRATWTPTYSFQLQPVPLELVDLLAAKIRDQEDLIERLQGEVGELKTKVKAPAAPVFVRATAVKQVGMNQVIQWKADAPIDAIEFTNKGQIRFRAAGVFVVNVTVQHTTSGSETAFVVKLNGAEVQVCRDGDQYADYKTATVSYAFTAKDQDEITVVYNGNSNALVESSVVIYQLR